MKQVEKEAFVMKVRQAFEGKRPYPKCPHCGERPKTVSIELALPGTVQYHCCGRFVP